MKSTFVLKKEHVKLLTSGRVFIEWDFTETGAPAINPKRPYGNSSVAEDVAEILGWGQLDEEDLRYEEAMKLHYETKTALSVILNAKTFIPGVYEADHYHQNWKWKHEDVS